MYGDNKDIGTQFTTALEAFKYLEDNNFLGRISARGFNWPEKVKFCRWVNGMRCKNFEGVIEPTPMGFAWNGI
jgi:hypothetical protein